VLVLVVIRKVDGDEPHTVTSHQREQAEVHSPACVSRTDCVLARRATHCHNTEIVVEKPNECGLWILAKANDASSRPLDCGRRTRLVSRSSHAICADHCDLSFVTQFRLAWCFEAIA
jgi:hypothetical protein